MKIYFVGIHNKNGRTALDSRTRTGKVIDEISKHLPLFETVKTNLCAIETFPDNKDISIHNDLWYNNHNPTKDDLIVLLGAWVKDNFEKRDFRVLKLNHPAGEFRRGKTDEYIKKSVIKILEEC